MRELVLRYDLSRNGRVSLADFERAIGRDFKAADLEARLLKVLRDAPVLCGGREARGPD